jgi:hypothetical protein
MTRILKHGFFSENIVAELYSKEFFSVVLQQE